MNSNQIYFTVFLIIIMLMGSAWTYHNIIVPRAQIMAQTTQMMPVSNITATPRNPFIINDIKIKNGDGQQTAYVFTSVQSTVSIEIPRCITKSGKETSLKVNSQVKNFIANMSGEIQFTVSNVPNDVTLCVATVKGANLTTQVEIKYN